MKYGIEIIFIIAFIVIVVLSCGENYDFWKDLSSLLIVVLIFVISSLWAVRSSAFYSYVQERQSFYHYMTDHEDNYKWYKDKEKIIKDPASQYLSSARNLRSPAIVYNMMLFYLFICLFFLFIQFLFNLKDGNITIWFWTVLLVVIAVFVGTMVYKIIRCVTIEIVFLMVLCLLLLGVSFTVLFLFIFYHFELIVLPLINILLFSIASYLAYLSYRIHQTIFSKADPFNGFVIWTYDNMNIIPFLEKKKDSEMNPDVKKENEMVTLWKWSFVLHLKEIFHNIDYNGNINEEQRKNEQYVENLIAALAASEWKDSSIIYLYAITMRLLSFLKINNCYKVVIKKSRYKNAGKAAEKRWNDKKKELKNLDKELENLRKRNYEDEKNDPTFIKKRIEKECKKKELKERKGEIKSEIENLKNLFEEINEIPDIIGRIEKICNKILIEIEELKETKNEEKKEEVKKEIKFLSELLEKIKDGIEEGFHDKIKKKIDELKNKLPNVETYKEEIKILEELLTDINKVIDKKEFNKFKSKKDEIKNICDKLIEIYKDRTKN